MRRICVLLSLAPILAKWAVIGRWTPRQIRIWSLDYLRFWTVKFLIRSNPLVLFRGTPIYNAYLRALGAKIGRNVVIDSPHVPVCTDLLTIGDNAVIRKDTYYNCYRAHAGVIQTGPVNIGKDTLVGEMTVLDIDTSLGDGAQIGHSSALYAGQSIPAGEHRCGSPAEHLTTVDYRDVPAAECGTLRKVVYCLIAVLTALLITSAFYYVLTVIVDLFAGRPHFATPGVPGVPALGDVCRCHTLLRALLCRHDSRRALDCGHRPAAAQPRTGARQGLPTLRRALRDPSGDREDDQRNVLHLPVRRQLLRRQLCEMDRL